MKDKELTRDLTSEFPK